MLKTLCSFLRKVGSKNFKNPRHLRAVLSVLYKVLYDDGSRALFAWR